MHHTFVADELDLVHSVTLSASRSLPDAARSETLPSASRRFQMLSDCPRRSHALPYASRRSYVHPDTPRCSQKCSQTSPHGSTRSSTLSVVPIGSHIFPNAAMLSQTFPDAPRCPSAQRHFRTLLDTRTRSQTLPDAPIVPRESHTPCAPRRSCSAPPCAALLLSALLSSPSL